MLDRLRQLPTGACHGFFWQWEGVFFPKKACRCSPGVKARHVMNLNRGGCGSARNLYVAVSSSWRDRVCPPSPLLDAKDGCSLLSGGLVQAVW